jgi:hypothetical protein
MKAFKPFGEIKNAAITPQITDLVSGDVYSTACTLLRLQCLISILYSNNLFSSVVFPK